MVVSRPVDLLFFLSGFCTSCLFRSDTTGLLFSLEASEFRFNHGYIVVKINVSPIGWNHEVGLVCTTDSWVTVHHCYAYWVHNDDTGEENWEVALCLNRSSFSSATHIQIKFAIYAKDTFRNTTSWDNNDMLNYEVNIAELWETPAQKTEPFTEGRIACAFSLDPLVSNQENIGTARFF
ncbi:hypothetical protein Pelo_11626 [Pelomyxa schiedti]|nr:hypothetical protein Pelo_11626 [Pelomyxa schiedti]